MRPEEFLKLTRILDNGCREWAGKVTAKGSGHTTLKGKAIGAHRLAYLLFKGSVAPGLQVDHTCHTKDCDLAAACPHRRCVNPDHLEAVTAAENVRRGRAGLANPKTRQKPIVGTGPWLSVGKVAKLLGTRPEVVRSFADAGRLNDPVPMWRLPVRGDRRIHKDSAERLRQELQGN
jgi:hypothetical protein